MDVQHIFQYFLFCLSNRSSPKIFWIFILSLLISQSLRQLPFIYHYSGIDTNNIFIIAIVCMFLWSVHHFLYHGLSCFQYARVVTFTSLDTPLWESEVDPFFGSDYSCFVGGGTFSICPKSWYWANALKI